MFAEALSNLPLTDSVFSEYVSEIKADCFKGDVSFCASLRALMLNRNFISDKVAVHYGTCGFIKENNETLYHVRIVFLLVCMKVLMK